MIRVQEDTHSIRAVLLADTEVAIGILVVEVHMIVVLGTVLAAPDQVCCTVAGHMIAGVEVVGSRHTAGLEVVGRMMVAVVRRNLVVAVEDIAKVVRTAPAVAAVLRFARIAGTSSLRMSTR